MLKLQIVELIGDHRARLSPAGKAQWEAAQLLETSRPGTDNTTAMAESLQKAGDLPQVDQIIWGVLTTLFLGLHATDLAEDRWGTEVADKFRTGFIIKAAHERATAEGRTVLPEPDMTLDEALVLLAEDYSPN